MGSPGERVLRPKKVKDAHDYTVGPRLPPHICAAGQSRTITGKPVWEGRIPNAIANMVAVERVMSSARAQRRRLGRHSSLLRHAAVAFEVVLVVLRLDREGGLHDVGEFDEPR